MKNDKMLDMYSDYLISAFGQTTTTGLSALLNGEISHDRVQRFLAEGRKTSANLWRIVKLYVRKIESEDGKAKRRSPKTKNEYYCAMTQQALRNQIKFKYMLNDVWFSFAENMKFVKLTLKKEFIMPLKAKRKVAVSLSAKRNGHYLRVDTLALEAMQRVTIHLEGVEFPLLLLKQVFKNEDGATGILYLVTSDITLSGDDMATLYQKRWNVEPYHKSLKQNASPEQSPTQTVTTRTNHLFASLCGFVKLELLKDTTKLNHFALKSKLYLHALQSAYATLREFHPVSLAT
jgi:DDE family transposase